jgi:3'-phosphoadenosine 5'-phosphosulfate sulfotransferase (PAPS reductase)/FAD synthetase
MRTKEDLRQMQALPLGAKILMTKNRVREWVREYGESGVYVSFSGGKDSTVLLHIVRSMYPDIEAVFVNTGLEYPEIQKFVKTFDNVTILRPEMRFDEVIKKYGYPIISKEVSHKCHDANTAKRTGHKDSYALRQFNGTYVTKNGKTSAYSIEKWKPLLDVEFNISHKCCDVMKKKPAKMYERATGKKPILAIMADESKLREQGWLKEGCNAFEAKRPQSRPMSFWTEQDVLQYIKENNLRIASVYGQIEYATDPEQMRLEDYGFTECGTERLTTTGCYRTGCIFCAFGCHLEGSPSRFQRLKETHPRQYEYCIGGGEYIDGVWQPNKKGLGMGHIFDELNKIYGDGFIKY